MIVALMLSLSGCTLWQQEAGVARVGPQRPPTHPRANGPVEVIGKGEIDGREWELTAYRSKDGICVDLHMGSGSSGGCGFGRMRGALSIPGMSWSSDMPKYAQLDGRVSQRVARLTARSGEGAVQELPLHRSERFGLTFFVAFAPVDADYELTAYDDEGEVLGTKVLPRSELDPEDERL